MAMPTRPFSKPAYWSDEPAPKPGVGADDFGDDGEKLSLTRYGDWVKNGIAIDF